MYQRKNTPSMSTLQYCQHTRDYLKGARSAAKERRDRFLGRRPFSRKPAQEPEPGRQGQQPTTREDGTRDRHPAPSTRKDQTSTRPRLRHTDGRPSRKANTQTTRKAFCWRNFRSFHPLPFRRCCDRFLGHRPRHAAALGLSDQLRAAMSQTN